MAPSILKPDPLTVLPKIFGQGGRNNLTVNVFAGFALEDRGRLINEDQLWEAAAMALNKDQVLDQGLPKPQAEVLLAGKCFARNRKPVQALEASFSLGGLNKKAYVFGNRRWESKTGGLMTSMSESEPFSEMDLTWSRAFGGPDFPDNPEGVGLGEVRDMTGRTFFPLPNLEDPQRLIASPKDRPSPVCFGPLGLSWPNRLKNLGTFDDRWLRDVWPGLPDDFDFRAFNLAPPDQRIQGFFRGDEKVTARYLHPDRSLIESSLPGLRMRIFINRKDGGQDAFQELTSRLDTVWLFPHLDRGALIWRGTVAVADEEAPEISHILTYPENLSDSPHPPEYYRDLMTAPRVEEPAAPLEPVPPPEEVLSEEPSPEPVEASPAASDAAVPLTETAEKIKVLEAQLASHFRSLGIDPDQITEATPGPSPPPEYPDLPDGLAPAERLARIKSHADGLEKKLDRMLKSMGVDPGADVPETVPTASMPVETLIAALKRIGGDNQELIAELEEMAAENKRLVRELAERPPIPEPRPEKAPAPVKPYLSLTREAVLAGHAAGSGFAGKDLTGLDLSGCDLTGIDLKDAVLEKTNFSGAVLTRADLTRSLAAGADFSQARLNGTILTGAAFPNGMFSGADLTGADLSQADLSRADLSGADLSGAIMNKADLSRGILTRARGQGLTAPGLRLAEADLTEADFRESDLTAGILTGATLEKTNFSGAKMQNVYFSEAKGRGAIFNEADLTSSRAAGPTGLPQSDFSGADLSGAYWEEADLSGAVFNQANLNQTSFLRCRLQNAAFKQARANRADFSKSDLDAADLRYMDLLSGSLRQASLRGTDLRLANLFAVDFYKSIHAETRLDGANIKRTLLSLWAEKSGNR